MDVINEILKLENLVKEKGGKLYINKFWKEIEIQGKYVGQLPSHIPCGALTVSYYDEFPYDYYYELVTLCKKLLEKGWRSISFGFSIIPESPEEAGYDVYVKLKNNIANLDIYAIAIGMSYDSFIEYIEEELSEKGIEKEKISKIADKIFYKVYDYIISNKFKKELEELAKPYILDYYGFSEEFEYSLTVSIEKEEDMTLSSFIKFIEYERLLEVISDFGRMDKTAFYLCNEIESKIYEIIDKELENIK